MPKQDVALRLVASVAQRARVRLLSKKDAGIVERVQRAAPRRALGTRRATSRAMMRGMQRANLLSFRTALLAGLGLVHGCGGRTAETGSDRSPNTTSGNQDGGRTQPGPNPPASDAATPGGGTTGNPPSKPTPTGTTTSGPATPPTTSVPVGPTATGTVTPTPTGMPTAMPTGPVTTGTTMPPPAGPEWCMDPEPMDPSRLHCENGVVVRVQQPMCESSVPRAERIDLVFPNEVSDGGVTMQSADAGSSLDAGTPELPYSSYVSSQNLFFSYTCDEDSDCTEMAHGYCQFNHDWSSGESYTSGCRYGCQSDDECGDGYLCDCGSPVGTCVSATCRTGADCEPNQACARWEYSDGCGITTGYVCTTADRGCLTDSDCDVNNYEGCSGTSGKLQCETQNCVIGRPFLVQGEVRKAGTQARCDWSAESGTQPSFALAAATALAKQAAAEWTRVALMEHASVAAFARFALQLLAVGAPPELLLATSQAMSDETRHAQLAFGLARRFGAVDVGPGALQVQGSLDELDLKSITLTTLLEGCIGETVAALEAKLALEHVRDAGLAEVLGTIARDESNHALLAWRFVQWALGAQPELAAEVMNLARVELQRASIATVHSSPTDEALLAYGVVGDGARAQLRAAALKDVVLPCLEVLSASPNSVPRALAQVLGAV